MSVGFVQSADHTTTSNVTATVTFASNNVAGNTIMLAIAQVNGGTSGSISSVMDSQGNTYTVRGGLQTYAGYQLAFYYCLSCIGGANTITVVWTTPTATDLSVAEFSNVLAFDKNTTIGKNTGTATTGTFTPTAAGELIIAAQMTANGTSAITSGFSNDSGNCRGLQWKLSGSGSAQSMNASTPNSCVCCVSTPEPVMIYGLAFTAKTAAPTNAVFANTD